MIIVIEGFDQAGKRTQSELLAKALRAKKLKCKIFNFPDYSTPLGKEIMKEIGNKSREFFEFVLPPIDIQIQNDNLVVTVDLPGFDKKDIKLRINGNILSISAEREIDQDGTVIWHQRPHLIDKKIRLPVDVTEGEDLEGSAKYHNGVLTLKIPVKRGKDIVIE